MSLGLEGNVAVREHFRSTGSKQSLRRLDTVLGIELGLLIAEDFLAVDAMDNLLAAADLDLHFHPLSGGKRRRGGLDDMFGDKFPLHHDIGAGGADVCGGACALSLIGKELILDADGKRLIETHALR